MMDTSLIHTYCQVVKEVFTPIHGIFFFEDGWGTAEIDDPDEGVISYSCESVEEFDELVELSVRE